MCRTYGMDSQIHMWRFLLTTSSTLWTPPFSWRCAHGPTLRCYLCLWETIPYVLHIRICTEPSICEFSCDNLVNFHVRHTEGVLWRSNMWIWESICPPYEIFSTKTSICEFSFDSFDNLVNFHVTFMSHIWRVSVTFTHVNLRSKKRPLYMNETSDKGHGHRAVGPGGSLL